MLAAAAQGLTSSLLRRVAPEVLRAYKHHVDRIADQLLPPDVPAFCLPTPRGTASGLPAATSAATLFKWVCSLPTLLTWSIVGPKRILVAASNFGRCGCCCTAGWTAPGRQRRNSETGGPPLRWSIWKSPPDSASRHRNSCRCGLRSCSKPDHARLRLRRQETSRMNDGFWSLSNVLFCE